MEVRTRPALELKMGRVLLHRNGRNPLGLSTNRLCGSALHCRTYSLIPEQGAEARLGGLWERKGTEEKPSTKDLPKTRSPRSLWNWAAVADHWRQIETWRHGVSSTRNQNQGGVLYRWGCLEKGKRWRFQEACASLLFQYSCWHWSTDNINSGFLVDIGVPWLYAAKQKRNCVKSVLSSAHFNLLLRRLHLC